MLKIILLRVLLVALPFMVYALYVALVQKQDPRRPESWHAAPFAWLSGISLAALVASFIVLALTSGERAGSSYTPARYEDGELIPGEIDPPDPDGKEDRP